MVINNPRAPLIQQGWLRAVICCAAIILVSYMSGYILGTSLAVTGNTKVAQDPEKLGLLGILMAVITGITLSIVFRLFIDRKPVISLGFDRLNEHRNEPLEGLLLAIVLMGLGALILYFTGALRWVDIRFDGPEFFIQLILMLLVAVSEEMVFRGYVLNNLMESFGKQAALAASAGIFTLAHIFNPEVTPIGLSNIFLGGALLGINFIYTRSLWFSIGLHFGWNFIQGHVLGFAVSGYTAPTLLQQELKGHPVLTGGAFGVEGSLVTTGLLAAGILLLYYMYERKYAAVKQAI
jgi:membrane protease YdiL (CAAX protease family)